jgi:excisionase family DNA binding protein
MIERNTIIDDHTREFCVTANQKGHDMAAEAQNPIRNTGILPIEFADRSTLTIEESAKILRISRNSAYAAANDRSLPTVKIGRRLLVPRVALEKLLAGG